MKKKLLFIAQIFPYPPNSGGPIKSFNMIKGLSKKFDITLVSYIRSEKELLNISELKKYCVDIIPIKIKRSNFRNLGFFFLSLFSAKPFVILRDYTFEMSKKIKQISQNFDYIYADHLQMAQFIPKNYNGKTILDEHNVEHVIWERFAKNETNMLKKLIFEFDSKKLRKYEINECDKFDKVLCVSKEDKYRLLKLNSKLNIAVLPIGVDTKKFKSIQNNKNSRSILSIGTMYWPPNVDSILYFYREIFPIIKKEVPNAILTIIGKRPPKSITNLAKDSNVIVKDYVKNEEKYLKECAAFIVPLRIGGGMRVKIINSLSQGLPIVSTSVGVEGIEVKNNVHLLIRDDPKKFGEAVVTLIKDRTLRNNLSIKGRNLAIEKYDWKIIYKKLDKVIA